MAYAYPHCGRWQATHSPLIYINRLLPHVTCVIQITSHKHRLRYNWRSANLEHKTSIEGVNTSYKRAKQAALAAGWELNNLVVAN
jgi:predicted RNase H-like nuclease (RuvC/YqgF family)